MRVRSELQRYGRCYINNAEEAPMGGTRLIGIVLIVLGLAALAWPAITFTRTEEVLDVGPVEVTTQERERIPIPPLVGGVAVAAGVALIVLGGRKVAH
jgi:uncharacterized membrane protein HdeD (DUF308 family)